MTELSALPGDAPTPNSVVAAFDFPAPARRMTPVPGAGSNRVYRLDAGGQAFAVKELRNPWADPRWREWLDDAWHLEQHAIAAGVAAPPPVANLCSSKSRPETRRCDLADEEGGDHLVLSNPVPQHDTLP